MAVETLDYIRALRELELERTEVLAELMQWPPGRLSYRPSAGAWSVVEVLDHIVRAESGTIAAVRVGLRDPHILGTEERPNIAALDQALRSDQSFQVPAAATAIHPDAQTTLPEVAQRWEDARIDLRSLLEALEPAHSQCGVFCHPFAGWMTVADVLDHFSAHFYHHEFQLARLRASSAHLHSEQAIPFQ